MWGPERGSGTHTGSPSISQVMSDLMRRPVASRWMKAEPGTRLLLCLVSRESAVMFGQNFMELWPELHHPVVVPIVIVFVAVVVVAALSHS